MTDAGKCLKCGEHCSLYDGLCARCWSGFVVTGDYLSRVIAIADLFIAKFSGGERAVESASWVCAASWELTSRLRQYYICSYDMRYARPFMEMWLVRVAYLINRTASNLWALEKWLLEKFGAWPSAE